MKITIYTVSDCKFSQAEKEYLNSKGLQFEEKNLETNRDFLTEMLQKSNNFAGTPVTELVKDDGTTLIIKGFTQTEFDAALGTTTATPAVQPMPQPTTQAQEPMANPQPTADISQAVNPPVSEPQPVEPMPTTPVANEPQMPPMNEAASAMNVPPPAMPSMPDTTMPAAPVMDTTMNQPSMNTSEPTASVQPPAMPTVAEGQVLSDNLSAPVTTTSMTPGTSQTYSTEPPTPQGGPANDLTAGISATPSMPMAPADTAAPAQPATDTTNPLNSVLNDLQSKANS